MRVDEPDDYLVVVVRRKAKVRIESPGDSWFVKRKQPLQPGASGPVVIYGISARECRNPLTETVPWCEAVTATFGFVQRQFRRTIPQALAPAREDRRVTATA